MNQLLRKTDKFREKEPHLSKHFGIFQKTPVKLWKKNAGGNDYQKKTRKEQLRPRNCNPTPGGCLNAVSSQKCTTQIVNDSAESSRFMDNFTKNK